MHITGRVWASEQINHFALVLCPYTTCLTMLSKAPSLLEQLEQHLNVDCDNLDPAFIQTLPIRPHDQTSNQRIVHEAFVAPENKEFMEKTVKEISTLSA
jgi:hypothetical protein